MAKVIKGVCGVARNLTSSTLRNFSGAQVAPLQQAALEERCILVNDQDKPLGEASKRDCHTVNLGGQVLLHRAFSVFLFNGEGQLLLQKRSANKVSIARICRNDCMCITMYMALTENCTSL